MLGTQRLRDGPRLLALIRRLGMGEPDREGAHRPLVQARHHREHRRRIRTTGEEHAVGHVGALMQAHALLEDTVEGGERVGLR